MIEKLTQNQSAMKIIKALAAHGFETRFVGGCVRDAILGRDFNEIDMATNALPEDVMKILDRTIPTGIDHGTVTAVIDGKAFEITTLRKDVETDGRHAIVEFSNDWQEDAKRRDFTINALSVDANGEIFDYCDGLTDLKNKQLRFIGDAAQRIHEDYLRILRFFRFASQLDWGISDNKTLEICSKLSLHLASLSRERVQSELYKLLNGKGALRVITLLKKYNILSVFFNDIDIERFKDTIEISDQFIKLLALVGFKNPQQLEKFVIQTRDNKKRLDDLAKIANHADWKLHKVLYFYDQQSVKNYYYLTQPKWDFSAIKNWQKPVFPLKAIDVFNLSDGPGPKVGELMKRAENHWVDNNFKLSKQELLDFLNR